MGPTKAKYHNLNRIRGDSQDAFVEDLEKFDVVASDARFVHMAAVTVPKPVVHKRTGKLPMASPPRAASSSDDTCPTQTGSYKRQKTHYPQAPTSR